MLLHWLRRKAASPARRVAPQAEWLEPRLLFSADLGAGWLTPPVTPQDEEVRTLSTKGEYARTAAQPQSLAEAYVTTALNFEKNVGQVRDDIDFIASGSGYTIALSDGDADIVLAGAKAPVHLELVGGKDEVQARGEGLLGARSNYLLGNDESKWLTNIANYRAVLCEDVYRGVDVRYYGTQRQLEYDFIVAAGADASQIRLRFEGAEARLDGEGNLLLRTAEGRDIRFDAPVSYQQGAQGREAVASAYRLHADGSVSITLGDYDRSRELVIDPVLSYASYFGESGTESGVDVAVDALGKVYVAGNTNSTGGVLGTVLGGLFGSTGIDTFVARFNADLTALEWTTRVGGDLEDRATSIAVDAAGSAVVTGWTKSSNFATAGAAETAREGTQDAFVYRLDAGGASRAFATYFGDNNDAEVGNGVALDGSGNIYIAGAAAGASGSSPDAFVARYSSAGALQLQFKYGGGNDDSANDIAVDAAGNMYIVGNTKGGSPAMPGGHQTLRAGGDEGFLARFNSAGTLVYGTFIGGLSDDTAQALAVDGNGRAYVVGQTDNSDESGFALSSGAWNRIRLEDDLTGYLRIYDTDLTGAASLVYSTLVGGSAGDDKPIGVALRGELVVVLTQAASSDIAVTSDAAKLTHSTGALHIAIINPGNLGAGDLIWGSYYASSLAGGGLAVSGDSIYVAASTSASGLASATGADRTPSGQDALVGRISVTNDPPVLTGFNGQTMPEDLPGNGFLVRSLVTGKLTDANTYPGAVLGIAITGSATAGGTWEYSTDGGNDWEALGAPAPGAALLLAADSLTRLRFTPVANYNGNTASLTFRGWDRTAGVAAGTADASSGGGSSAFSADELTAPITVTPVNDAPVLTNTVLTLAPVNEDAGVPSGAVGTLVSTLVGGISDVDAGAAQGVAITGTAGSGSWYYSRDAGTTWTAVGTVSNNSALLLASDADTRLYFRPNPNYNGTVATGVTLRAWDQSSGTAGTKVDTSSNGGTRAFSSATDTVSIVVDPVNDAPVLANTVLTIAAVNEDAAAPSGAVGTLVSTLVGGSSDIDASAAKGVAITAADSANGSWYYSRDGGTTWTGVGAVANNNALLLASDANTRVYFRPDADYHGTVPSGLTVRAWDQTSGSAGSKVDASTNGGTSAFSSATDTIALVVNPVNDAPVLADTPLALADVNEDAAVPSGAVGTLVWTLVGGSSDVDAGAVQGVAITGTAGSGNWYYSRDAGTTWTAVGAVANNNALLLASDADTRLYFRPSANYNGTVATGLTLRAWDQSSGTAGTKVDASSNGGTTAFSSATDTVSIVVDPVNDAPVLANTVLTIAAVNEDAAAPSGAVGTLVSTLVGGSSDIDASAVKGVAITATDSANGSWYYSKDAGTTWTAVGVVANNNALLLASDANTRVYFQPRADYNGTVASGLTFRAWDQTAGAAGNKVDTGSNGGTTAFSSATDRVAVTVNAVNDAPVLADTVLNLVAVNEDAGAPAGAVGSLVSTLVGGSTDVDASPVKGIAITAADSSNGGWFYSTDGGTTWAAVGAVGDNSALLLASDADTRVYFRPTANYNGTVAAGLTIRAWDQTTGTAGTRVDASTNGNTTAFSSATDTVSIVVNPVNDAPVLADTPLTLPSVNEDAAAPAGPVGALVSTLVGGSTDIDVGAIKGIAITAADAGNGSWFYSTNGGTTWTAVGAVANTSALLLAADANTRVYFQPSPDYNGSVAAGLTIRAWDQTAGGAAGSKVDASAQGGTRAFSTATDTVSITVNPVADAPVLADTVLALSGVDEDAGAPSGAVGSLVSTLVGGSTDVDTGAVKGIAITAADASKGSWFYSTDGGTTWTAVGAVASNNALLLASDANTRVYFQPMANYNGTVGTGLTIRAWDQTSGTAGSKVDTGSNGGTTAFSSSTDTVSVTVNAVNDAPVLADTVLTLPAINEDAPAPVGGVGSLVSTLVGGSTDIDASAVKGIAITAADGSNGSWYYSTNGGTTWTAVGAVANNSALLLAGDASTRVYFQPAANYNGTVATGLTIRAWDATSGAAGTKVDASTGGGSTAFSVATDEVSITVNPVNDAPVLADTVLTLPAVTEDAAAPSGAVGTLVSTLAGGLADVDAGAIKGIAITAADAGNGTWFYSVNGGTTWSAVGTVSNTSALLLASNASTRVYFQPDADFSDTVAAGLTIRAWDQSSGSAGSRVDTSGNGGTTAFSLASDTVSISVTPINDAPVLTGGSLQDLAAPDGPALTPLGFAGVTYGVGGGADEALSQSLTVTITGLPASLGRVLLANGTQVTVGGSYTVGELQGMKFQAAAAVGSGAATFSFTLRDDGGTAGGGADSLGQSIAVTVVNRAPVLDGATDPLPGRLEGAAAGNGMLVADLLDGHITDPQNTFGIAVVAASSPGGSWEYSRDNGTNWLAFTGASARDAVLLEADGNNRIRFVAQADFAGTAGGLVFRGWDQSGGTAGETIGDTRGNGDASPYSATTDEATIVITAVNDPPVRTSGPLVDVAVAEGAPVTSLGLSGLTYGNGGGADENGQVLSFTVTNLPPAGFGTIQLADGSAVVTGRLYTLADMRGMQLALSPSATGGPVTFGFTVRDDGGTADGGIDTLAGETLQLRLLPNTAPVLGGANPLPTLVEDAAAGNGMSVADLIRSNVSDADPYAVGGIAVTAAASPGGRWQYSTNGGATWAGFGAVTDSSARLLAADGQSRIRFVAAPHWHGTADGLVFRAWDRTGGTYAQSVGDTTANGAGSPYSAATAQAQVVVTPVNDTPVQTGGTIANLTVAEGGTASLGLGGLTFGVGGGGYESSQAITYTITAVPPAGFGSVLLADGTTQVVAGDSYTLLELQGMRFTAAPGTTSGTATFAFAARDDGGTANGGVDTVQRSLSITVRNQAPVLNGANDLPTLLEDAATNTGMSVADLVSGRIGDPSRAYGIAVVAAASPSGAWQYSRDGGSTWSSLSGASDTAARLLAADNLSRVRFVPAADWNGVADGLVFRAWDRSGGTAGADTGDTTANGGTTPYSAGTAQARIVIAAVNDQPVRTSGPLVDVEAYHGAPLTSLGLGGLSYGRGGDADENGQQLSFTVTTLPPASFGAILLADGTAVVAGGVYTLADVRGMQLALSEAANGGPVRFGFTVRDDGGTADGGVDALAQSLQLRLQPNAAPVLSGANSLPTLVEDAAAGNGISVADLVRGQVRDTDPYAVAGIAVTAARATGGSWQYSTDGGATWAGFAGVSDASARLLAADGQSRIRFVAAADWHGTADGLVFRAWDRTGGSYAQTVGDTTVHGGNSAYSAATAQATVVVTAVNDAPVQTGGTVSDVTVAEGGTVSLGLGGLSFDVGGGGYESAQSMAYTITAVPATGFGSVVLADGTQVVAGDSYTLAQLQGMRFTAAPGTTSGSATFAFIGQDDGGTANGGVDTVQRSLAITVRNQAPVLTGSNALPSITEDVVTNAGMLVADLVAGHIADPSSRYGIAVVAAANPNGAWQYSRDGGSTWSSLASASETEARLLAADNLSRVRFVASPDWNGTASGLVFRAWDQSGGTAGSDVGDASSIAGTGAYSVETAEARIVVRAVNDTPVQTGGTVDDITVVEGGTTSLGLGGLSFSIGGGGYETSQSMTYTITAVPAAGFGSVLLDDGSTVVAGNSYTLAQLQAMRFTAAAGTTEGSATFSFSAQDGGGTANGGVDTVQRSLAITVRNQAPVLSGANALPAVLEDATANAGMLVADLVAGRITDPSGAYGIAVVAAAGPGGTWEYSRDGGASWSSLADAKESSAHLLAADALTRVRFVPVADWNGTASGLAFRAWDRSGGTAADATGPTGINGGSSAFSDTLATASIVVTPVNDAPVPLGQPPLEVVGDVLQGPIRLGLESLLYSPGGAADEGSQSLSLVITSLPPPALGTLYLADGVTPVRAGTAYAMAELRGMNFVPVAAGQGGGAAEIAYAVRDDGGTAGGGIDRAPGVLQLRIVSSPAPEQPPSANIPVNPPGPVLVTPPAAAAPAPAPAPAAPAPTGGRGNAPRAATGDALVEAAAPSTLMPAGAQMSFAVERRVIPLESVRPAIGMAERGAVQLAGFTGPSADFQVVGFNDLNSGATRLTIEQFQQTLRSEAFLEQMNKMRDGLRQEFDLDKTVSISVAGVSLGLSVAYVLWLVRGGVLVGSYLSALPAWRLLDPLPVLAHAGEEEEDEEDEPLDARGDAAPADPLRGFA